MFEVIRDAVIWIMSWVLDRQPKLGEATRLLMLILFTGIATWITFYWRDILYRSPTIRRRLLPNERYTGRYLQAVKHDAEIRYAIINIFFNRPKKRFEVAGRAYGPEGNDLSAFKSNFVLFPSEKDDNIEFIWQGRTAASANFLGGYTRMTVDSTDEDYIQGTGIIMSFGDEPKVYQLKFKHLHDEHVSSALGARAPHQIADEPEFIKKFHAMFGDAVREGFAASEQRHAA